MYIFCMVSSALSVKDSLACDAVLHLSVCVFVCVFVCLCTID